VAHRCDAPQNDGQGESLSHAQQVYDPADNEQTDRIRCGKGKYDVAVVDFAPVIEVLKGRLENSDDLAVDVIHSRGEGQKRADRPAKVAGPLLRSRCY